MDIHVRNFVCYVKGRREADNFQKQMLWKIFGPQTEKVRENWRKMSKDELHVLCFVDRVSLYNLVNKSN